jgi:hypothetical protein
MTKEPNHHHKIQTCKSRFKNKLKNNNHPKNVRRLSLVVHAYNPSYLGGRDRRISV